MVWFLKNVFSALIIRFFGKKKLKTVEAGKIGKYDEERVYFQKKHLHLFKSFLYKNGKAENMPLVAGRLVSKFAPNKRNTLGCNGKEFVNKVFTLVLFSFRSDISSSTCFFNGNGGLHELCQYHFSLWLKSNSIISISFFAQKFTKLLSRFSFTSSERSVLLQKKPSVPYYLSFKNGSNSFWANASI